MKSREIVTVVKEISVDSIRESSPTNGLCSGSEFAMLSHVSFCLLNNLPINIRRIDYDNYSNYFLFSGPIHLETGTIGFGWDNIMLLFYSTKKNINDFKMKMLTIDDRCENGLRQRLSNLEISGFNKSRQWYLESVVTNSYWEKLNSYIQLAKLELKVETEEQLYNLIIKMIISTIIQK